MLIGITMRMLLQEHTGDPYDALSRDWGRFFMSAGIQWIPLPNREKETLSLVETLSISGLILSGGEHIGQHSLRDTTERLLLDWAKKRCIPVIGICRGFQMIQSWLGGTLVPIENHVGMYHRLFSSQHAPKEWYDRVVNSYHELGIAQVPSPLVPLAFSKYNDTFSFIEAAQGETYLGIMWHPERERIPHKADITLISSFLMNNLCSTI